MCNYIMTMVAGIVTAIIGFSVFPSSAFASAYTDLDSKAWYYSTDYIEHVTDEGYMSGYKNTTHFGPDNTLTRAEAITILYRVLTTDPEQTTADPKKYAKANTTGQDDIEAGKFYTAAANWAFEEGIMTGYEGTDLFLPHNPISRQELVTIVGRSVSWKDLPEGSYWEQIARIVQYEDHDQLEIWSGKSFEWGLKMGIISGNSQRTHLYPRANATRAETAKIFTKFDTYLLGHPIYKNRKS